MLEGLVREDGCYGVIWKSDVAMNWSMGGLVDCYLLKGRTVISLCEDSVVSEDGYECRRRLR
jgi:hypothetical protein